MEIFHVGIFNEEGIILFHSDEVNICHNQADDKCKDHQGNHDHHEIGGSNFCFRNKGNISNLIVEVFGDTVIRNISELDSAMKVIFKDCRGKSDLGIGLTA